MSLNTEPHANPYDMQEDISEAVVQQQPSRWRGAFLLGLLFAFPLWLWAASRLPSLGFLKRYGAEVIFVALAYPLSYVILGLLLLRLAMRWHYERHSLVRVGLRLFWQASLVLQLHSLAYFVFTCRVFAGVMLPSELVTLWLERIPANIIFGIIMAVPFSVAGLVLVGLLRWRTPHPR